MSVLLVQNMYSYIILLTFLICSTKSVDVSKNVSLFAQMQYTDLFKYVVESEYEINECTNHLLEYLTGLSEMKPWALKMFDSSSKLHAGILRGNLFNLGDYDECLSVVKPTNKEFGGKYCLASLKIPVSMSKELNETKNIDANVFDGFTRSGTTKSSVSITQALCIPKSCSGSNIAYKISNITNNIIKLHINDDQCQIADDSKLSTVNICVLVIFCIYIFWLLLCTTIDFLQDIGVRRCANKYILAFSIYSNYKKIFATNNVQKGSHLNCLNGIRFWSMMWIIYSHRNFLTVSLPSINLVEGINWMTSIKGAIIVGSTVTVDTFLLLSGFLLTYSFYNHMETNGHMNWAYFYLHRYIRLTTVYIFIIIFHITLLKDLGSGPFWELLYNATTEQCNKYWYTAILYVQNYVNPNEICIGHSWYLSVDMQLYCLSPLLLYPMWKFRKLGKVFYFIILIFAEIVLILIVYFYKINVSGIVQSEQAKLDWSRLYYVPTHTRAVPWLIGVGLGYVIYKLKTYAFRVNIIFMYLGWLVALLICAGVIFGINPFVQPDYKYNQLNDTLYLSLSRVGWSLAICWIIFACLTGYGGLINRFLSMEVWKPFCKLSYCMYLVHLSFQTYHSASMRTPNYFSSFEMIYKFCGDFVFTALISLVITLMFESPILGLEKLILRKEPRQELSTLRRHISL